MGLQSTPQPVGGVVRDGNKLVVPRFGGADIGEALPSACVKCGTPSVEMLHKTYSWHNPWLSLLIFNPLILIPFDFLYLNARRHPAIMAAAFFISSLGSLGFVASVLNWLIFAAAVFVTRRKIDLDVPLCENHRVRRRNLILTSCLLVAAGLSIPVAYSMAGLPGSLTGVVIFLSVIMIPSGAAIGLWFKDPIRASRIDDHCGVFTGCAQVFLQQFPSKGESVLIAIPVISVQSGSSPPPPPRSSVTLK